MASTICSWFDGFDISIAYDLFAHCFMLEDGVEQDNHNFYEAQLVGADESDDKAC